MIVNTTEVIYILQEMEKSPFIFSCVGDYKFYEKNSIGLEPKELEFSVEDTREVRDFLLSFAFYQVDKLCEMPLNMNTACMFQYLNIRVYVVRDMKLDTQIWSLLMDVYKKEYLSFDYKEKVNTYNNIVKVVHASVGLLRT